MSDLPPPPGGDSEQAPGPPPPPAELTPPPGLHAYRQAPTPAGTVSRIGGVSKAAVILTGLTIPATILSVIASSSVRDTASDFLRGEMSESDFLDEYAPVVLAQLVQGALTIAAAVLSVIWMYRMASNLRKYARDTTWAPLWAVFSWVLPPFLYVIPLLMLRELWQGSDPSAPPADPRWKKSGEQPLLYGWFAVYSLVPIGLAIFQFDALFGRGLGGDAEDLAKQLDEQGAVSLIGGASTVVAAVLWILVVRALTVRHTSLTGER